jgi:DNA-directed RNA polymerase specialized sigma24 family protein
VSTGRATQHADARSSSILGDERRVRRTGARIESSAATHFRALPDVALVASMRDGMPEAWFEFDARFRPLLEHYARRIGIPRWEASVCITEVLDDQALVLVDGTRGVPQHLSAYLVRALRNRFLELKRAAERRRHHYARAGDVSPHEEGLVSNLMSEHARRASEPLRVSEDIGAPSRALARFATLLAARMTDEERQMLGWVAESVPHRTIAAWLGISREAAKKRAARLARRLRGLAAEVSAQLSPNDQQAVENLLRRAGEARRVSRAGESDDG